MATDNPIIHSTSLFLNPRDAYGPVRQQVSFLSVRAGTFIPQTYSDIAWAEGGVLFHIQTNLHALLQALFWLMFFFSPQ